MWAVADLNYVLPHCLLHEDRESLSVLHIPFLPALLFLVVSGSWLVLGFSLDERQVFVCRLASGYV